MSIESPPWSEVNGAQSRILLRPEVLSPQSHDPLLPQRGAPGGVCRKPVEGDSAALGVPVLASDGDAACHHLGFYNVVPLMI